MISFTVKDLKFVTSTKLTVRNFDEIRNMLRIYVRQNKPLHPDVQFEKFVIID